MNKDSFILELNKMKIFPTAKQLDQLEQYYQLLIEYNNKMNLTGITKKEEIYLKHYYDSLTIIKSIDLINEQSLCDIGSGAGFPGIVLKIFYPHLEITLIDSLKKRVNFLNIVINKLALKKIKAFHLRIEEYGIKNREKFDIVTARAVSNINQLLEYAIPILKKNKYFIAMKGKVEVDNNYFNAMKKLRCKLVNIIEFRLPIENSYRSLMKFKKIDKTPLIFPRKYSNIKNKPL